MNDIVVIKNEMPLVSTFLLYEKMGYKDHRYLKELIDNNITSFEGFGVMRFETAKPKGKGGRPVKSYLLSEDQFILLAMMIRNSPDAIKLKVRIAKEFIRMKKTISNLVAQRKDSDWINTRKDGKAIYMQKTTVIKEFVDYAISQGSKSAQRYYTNIATMENKALFIMETKYPNMREVMTIKQLMQVSTADDVIEKALKDGMDRELPYKEIFKLAKERVIAFAGIIGVSHLHDLKLESK